MKNSKTVTVRSGPAESDSRGGPTHLFPASPVEPFLRLAQMTRRSASAGVTPRHGSAVRVQLILRTPF